MNHPVKGVPVYASSWPKGMRLVDVQRSYLINGYVLVFQGLQLIAVRVH